MLVLRLLEVRLKIAKLLSTTVWFWVVWWSVYWTRYPWESRDRDTWFKTSTQRCLICTCFWDKDAVSRMHSRFLSISRRRRHRMISRLSQSVSSHVSWTTTSSANPRKRKPSIRTRCHRESWICSRERLPRRWWRSKRMRLHPPQMRP